MIVQPRLNHTWEDIEARLREKGTSPELIENFRRCIEFHTYPAPGLLVGVYMVDYALELLKPPEGKKIYAVCETTKCLPDALQVMAHCTTGNHRLRVIPIGKFAITLNGPADAPYVNGVRVFVDGDKMQRKLPWKSAVCSICGEIVPDNMLVNGVCSDCRSQSYYEKVTC